MALDAHGSSNPPSCCSARRALIPAPAHKDKARTQTLGLSVAFRMDRKPQTFAAADDAANIDVESERPAITVTPHRRMWPGVMEAGLQPPAPSRSGIQRGLISCSDRPGGRMKYGHTERALTSLLPIERMAFPDAAATCEFLRFPCGYRAPPRPPNPVRDVTLIQRVRMSRIPSPCCSCRAFWENDQFHLVMRWPTAGRLDLGFSRI